MSADWRDPFSGVDKSIIDGMAAARAYLDARGPAELLPMVGQVIEEIPPVNAVDKAALQDSYGGDQPGPPDDLLVGRGAFYVTEQRKLFLDCTAGHYQMTFGYSDPDLLAAAETAARAGIVWDNHSNLPQTPVKLLAHKLAALAGDGLDTVLLGCVTGSVACAAALKIQLMCYERRAASGAPPVIVVLDGNYHGTDMVAQHLRGMWPHYVQHLVVEAVQPNDVQQLRDVFGKYGNRVAGFWAEPIMMNREAIVVEPEYLQTARALCTDVGALMVIDEIQTGFWQPEVFLFRTLGVEPDLVVAGKGMTAGFHPQSALIYRHELDVLAQYDAISTNGTAPLPCCMALCCIGRIEAEADDIVSVGDRYFAGLQQLAERFPDTLADARGKRHLGGLKFHDREQAIDFHRRAVAGGLWLRVHAYHEGHSTVLTKLPLVADAAVVDYLLARLGELLEETQG